MRTQQDGTHCCCVQPKQGVVAHCFSAVFITGAEKPEQDRTGSDNTCPSKQNKESMQGLHGLQAQLDQLETGVRSRCTRREGATTLTTKPRWLRAALRKQVAGVRPPWMTPSRCRWATPRLASQALLTSATSLGLPSGLISHAASMACCTVPHTTAFRTSRDCSDRCVTGVLDTITAVSTSNGNSNHRG